MIPTVIDKEWVLWALSVTEPLVFSARLRPDGDAEHVESMPLSPDGPVLLRLYIPEFETCIALVKPLLSEKEWRAEVDAFTSPEGTDGRLWVEVREDAPGAIFFLREQGAKWTTLSSEGGRAEITRALGEHRALSDVVEPLLLLRGVLQWPDSWAPPKVRLGRVNAQARIRAWDNPADKGVVRG